MDTTEVQDPVIDWARLRAGMRKAAGVPKSHRDYGEAQVFLQQAQGLLQGHIAELRQEAQQYGQEQQDAIDAPDFASNDGTGQGILRAGLTGLAQGATLGQADKLHGAAQVILDKLTPGNHSPADESYAMGRAMSLQSRNAAMEQRPGVTIAGDVIGSGAVTGLAQMGAMRAVPALGDMMAAGRAPGASITQKLAGRLVNPSLLGGIGAAEGGIRNGVPGALIGGIGGAGVGVLGDAVGDVVRGVRGVRAGRALPPNPNTPPPGILGNDVPSGVGPQGPSYARPDLSHIQPPEPGVPGLLGNETPMGPGPAGPMNTTPYTEGPMPVVAPRDEVPGATQLREALQRAASGMAQRGMKPPSPADIERAVQRAFANDVTAVGHASREMGLLAQRVTEKSARRPASGLLAQEMQPQQGLLNAPPTATAGGGGAVQPMRPALSEAQQVLANIGNRFDLTAPERLAVRNQIRALPDEALAQLHRQFTEYRALRSAGQATPFVMHPEPLNNVAKVLREIAVDSPARWATILKLMSGQ